MVVMLVLPIGLAALIHDAAKGGRLLHFFESRHG
jgi:hypothetical protein